MAYQDNPDLAASLLIKGTRNLPTNTPVASSVWTMQHGSSSWVPQWYCVLLKTNLSQQDNSYPNEDTALLEFYSLDTNQFVSDYYVGTLRDHQPDTALGLYGAVPSWTISFPDLEDILSWALQEAQKAGLSIEDPHRS